MRDSFYKTTAFQAGDGKARTRQGEQCPEERQGLQRPVKLRNEAADKVFIALEEDPLAYLAGSNQTGPLQRGEMR